MMRSRNRIVLELYKLCFDCRETGAVVVEGSLTTAALTATAPSVTRARSKVGPVSLIVAIPGSVGGEGEESSFKYGSVKVKNQRVRRMEGESLKTEEGMSAKREGG